MNIESPGNATLPYSLRSRLAVGFSSEIWKAEMTLRTAPPIECALRISHRPFSEANSAQNVRLLQYVVALGSTPGMPVIHAIEEWSGRIIVVTTLAETDCSKLFLKQERPAEGDNLPLLRTIVEEVALTLDCIREQGFIYGGISPEHILVSKGRAMLAGFSRCGRFEDKVRGRLPVDLMTQSCMPPEVQNGFPDVTSDQYSLAATYLALRTGMTPSCDSSWPYDYICSLGEHEGSIVAKALSRSASDRFHTCQEFATELRLAMV